MKYLISTHLWKSQYAIVAVAESVLSTSCLPKRKKNRELEKTPVLEDMMGTQTD